MTEIHRTDDEAIALTKTQVGPANIPMPNGEAGDCMAEMNRTFARLADNVFADLQIYKDGLLTVGMRAGKFYNGPTLVEVALLEEQAITNNATNHVYLNTAGTQVITTSAMPSPASTPNIWLADVVAADGAITSIIDRRGTSQLTLAGATGSGSVLNEDFQNSILDEIDFTSAEPAAPTLADRYLNTATGTSSATSQSVTADNLYEWNGIDWTEFAPTAGTKTTVEDRSNMMIGYTGSAWIDLGTFANIKDLTDGGNADALHVHSALDGYTHDLGGIMTTAGAFTLAGAYTSQITFTANTAVTFPTSGTLMNNTLADGTIFVGNASNAATGVAMSGDITITNAGVTSIGASKVVLAHLAAGCFNVAYGIPQLNADGELVGPILPRYETLATLEGMGLGNGELAVASDTNQVLVGDGTTDGGWAIGCDRQTIVVRKGSTNLVSGTNLLAAYAKAKTMSPSITNPITLKLPSGIYELAAGNNTFVPDTDYIHMIAEGVCRSDGFGNITYPTTIITGASVATSGVITAPTKVTARYANIRGIKFVNTTTASSQPIASLILDEANGSDGIELIDCGFSCSNAGSLITAHAVTGVDSNDVVSCKLTQCHSLSPIMKCDFQGTAIDCTSEGNSFGKADGTTNGAVTLIRCTNTNRSLPLSFQGYMEDCKIEVPVTGKSAVQLFSVNVKIGAGDATDNGGGDTDTVVITGDVEDDFPVGSIVYNVADSTFHRVTSSTYSSPDTTVELATAASTTFASRTDIRAYKITRLINNTLVTLDTAAVDSYLSMFDVPAIIAHNRMTVDIDSKIKNQIATPYNVIDLDFVSMFKEFE